MIEELFDYRRLTPHLASSLDALAAAMRDTGTPTRFVISMREDTAMELAPLRPRLPRVFDNLYRLEKLGVDQARSGIEEPLHRVGWRWDPSPNPKPLVERLLTPKENRSPIGSVGTSPP